MQTTDKAPDLSIVVPCFNEAENTNRILSVLNAVCEPLVDDYEIIMINDGSTDDTELLINTASDKDARVKPVHFSRNFGKEAALVAGLEQAGGRCILFLDADLQHPPTVIPEMYELWRNGAHVVNAVKRQRSSESPLYRLFAHIFNKVMSASVGSDMSGASDFKLIDRQVADALLSCPEHNRFFRGLVAWVGFKVVNVEFDVVERVAGTSKWSPGALILYSISNIVSFSSWPLRVVSIAGFAAVGLGTILLIQTLLNYFSGSAVSGFTTVVSLQILLSGMILTALGVVGIYISKIFDEQKKRPLFIVKKNS